MASLPSDLESGLPRTRYYLARHIELDEESHAPMAIKVMSELCGDDHGRWDEAAESVRTALRSRIALWDGVAGVLQERRGLLSLDLAELK
jgi:hypothetical protein